MNKKIKTGLLAYGLSGKAFHAPFLEANDFFELSAVVERSDKTAHLRYPKITSYGSVNEILADTNLDLIVINTPNDTHFEFAKLALTAGKHVLIEKPVTQSLAAFQKLVLLGKQTGRHVFVFQNRRYDSHFMAVRDIVGTRELGEIVEAHFRYDRYDTRIKKSAGDGSQSNASGLSYDLGPHLIDQAISLFGKPDRFVKVTSNIRHASDVDNYFNFHLIYNQGLNVYLTGSLNVADPQPGYILHGTKGSFVKTFSDRQEDQLLQGMLPTDEAFGLELPESKGILTTVDEGGKKNSRFIYSDRGNYNLIFDAIHDCIVNKKPYPITDSDISYQLEMLQSKGR